MLTGRSLKAHKCPNCQTTDDVWNDLEYVPVLNVHLSVSLLRCEYCGHRDTHVTVIGHNVSVEAKETSDAR